MPHRKDVAPSADSFSRAFRSVTFSHPWSFALISFLTTKEFMAAYGWRIAFMSGVIPVVLALYIRNNLHESPEFEKAKASGKMDEFSFLELVQAPSSLGLSASLLLYDRPVPHRLLGVRISA